MFTKLETATQMALRWHFLLALILACAAWVYWPVFSAGYVWDDHQLFVHNALLTSGDFSWSVLGRPVLPNSSYFRPLVLLSFVTEFQFSGAVPAVSHAVNLGFFLLNCGLVYWLAFALLRRTGSSASAIRASLAAMIYSVHPALVESTAWISGRFDLMMTTFVLLALCAEVTVRNRAARTILVSLLFAAALGCKESAVVLPPCLLLTRLIHDWKPDESFVKATVRILSSDWITVVVLAITFAAYLVIKASAVGTLLTVGEPEGVDNTLAGHLILILNTVIYYVKVIIYPFVMISPLNPLDAHNVVSAQNAAIGALAFAGLGGATILAIRREAPGLLSLAGFVALLPILNIVPLSITDNIGHNRFLTLPLALLCVSVSLIRIPENKDLSRTAQSLPKYLLIAGWTVGAAAATESIVPLWNNSNSLWTWVYNLHPDSRMAAAQYATAALQTGRPKVAREVLERIRDRHGSFTFYEQLFYAECLLLSGDLEEGKKYLRGMTNALPQYHLQSDQAASRREVQATSAAEVLASAFWYLAIADLIEGRSDEAIQNAHIAVWYQPQNPGLIMGNALVLEHFARENEANALRETVRNLVGDAGIVEAEGKARSSLMRFPALAASFSSTASVVPDTAPPR